MRFPVSARALCRLYRFFILRQPFLFGYKHIVGKLPNLGRIADGARKRIEEHRLFKQPIVAGNRGADGKALHADALRADGGGSRGQFPDGRNTDAVAINVAGNFHDGVRRQVRYRASVNDVEMTTIYFSRFEGFDDIRAVLLASFCAIKRERLFFHPVREIGLEPVPSFGANAQIAPGFSIDPDIGVDPVRDFIGPFPVPGQVLAQVAV